MKLVHAADLHLDSPLRGLERYEGAPVDAIRGATRRALENLVELCLGEAVDLVLIAGDLYDGNWRDYSTGLFFAAQMSRLREAAIPVVLVRGNHDAASQISRHLELPENVRELSTHTPETRVVESLGIAVHGQGFAKPAVTDDLAARYPDPIRGLLNVGLLHTSLNGREGHESYAPCAPTTLLHKGYDYWALGHVHQREVVATDPWIVFPGNLQGRHARECGAKGATVVHCEGGRVIGVEHRPLDAVRWQVIEVGLAHAVSADDAVDLVREAIERGAADADGLLLAARLQLVGSTRAHESLHDDPERWTAAIRAAANDVAADAVWVEQIRFETQPMRDVDTLAERDDALGHVLRALRELRDDDVTRAALAQELGELDRKLPHELREGAEGLRLEEPATVRAILDEIEQMLVPRLLGEDRGT